MRYYNLNHPTVRLDYSTLTYAKGGAKEGKVNKLDDN